MYVFVYTYYLLADYIHALVGTCSVDAADSICTTNRFNQGAMILGHICSEYKHAHLSLKIKNVSKQN